MLTVFAHGSGIDDVLWFLVPVVAAMIVLRRVEKRAARHTQDDSDTPDSN